MTVIMMGVLDDILEPEISQENKDHVHDHEGMCVIVIVVITFLGRLYVIISQELQFTDLNDAYIVEKLGVFIFTLIRNM